MFPSCLQNHARFWLSALAVIFDVMGTKIDRVDCSSVTTKLLQHISMDLTQFRLRQESLRHRSLVSRQNDQPACLIKRTDPLCHAREEFEFFPSSNIPALRQLQIDNSIAIEEDTSVSRDTHAT